MIITYFGSPGCGKTTFAVKLMRRERRRISFANFEHTVPGARVCDLKGLGEWTFPPGSVLHIDEAGIEYNNRKFKSLPQKTIEWFKLHRHYRIEQIHIYSQSWEDMDVTLRRLSDQLWYIRKIGPFSIVRRVYKRVMVDEKTKQIIDGYEMAHLLWLLLYPLQCLGIIQRRYYIYFRPLFYKYFNSYSIPEGVPVKDFLPVSANNA